MPTGGSVLKVSVTVGGHSTSSKGRSTEDTVSGREERSVRAEKGVRESAA